MKDGQGFARRINLKNLQQFAPLLARKRNDESSVSGDDEPDPVSATRDSKVADPEVAKAELLFAGKRFMSDQPFTPPDTSVSTNRSGWRPTVANGVPAPVEEPIASVLSVTLPDRGMLRWQKILSKTDAQRQEGNPTGDIRLTQAKWKVEDLSIDQTTYFRNVVFREADWRPKNADVEEATVEFNVNILGTDYGQHSLVVSHKPSGEASQGNYTTGIQWGELMRVIRSVDLTRRTLRLYDPAAGGTAFTLEIA